MPDQLTAFFVVHHLRGPHSDRIGRHLDRIEYRGVIVLRLIDAGRDWPHPHWLGRERTHQITRISLFAEPARVIVPRENDRHSVMNVRHQLVGIRRDDCKSADPLARGRVLPIFPDTGNTERCPVFHAYGCFAFWPLIAFHSKKPSTGTMQRRLRYASRNVGRSHTVSHLAFMGLRPPVGSLHQYGISPLQAEMAARALYEEAA